MSRNSIPPVYAHHCAAALEAAWPGVRVIRFDADVSDPWESHGLPSDQLFNVDLVVAAPEDVLIRHGLLSTADAASIPPCGVCRRGPWRITRRKTLTRLELWGPDSLDVVAPVLVPAMVYRPPQPA